MKNLKTELAYWLMLPGIIVQFVAEALLKGPEAVTESWFGESE